MKVRIIRPNGYRGGTLRAACGDEVDVSPALAASMFAEGAAVPVTEAAGEDVAPVVAATRNGAAKRWKKKG